MLAPASRFVARSLHHGISYNLADVAPIPQGENVVQLTDFKHLTGCHEGWFSSGRHFTRR
jgi:hypothetical protein